MSVTTPSTTPKPEEDIQIKSSDITEPANKKIIKKKKKVRIIENSSTSSSTPTKLPSIRSSDASLSPMLKESAKSPRITLKISNSTSTTDHNQTSPPHSPSQDAPSTHDDNSVISNPEESFSNPDDEKFTDNASDPHPSVVLGPEIPTSTPSANLENSEILVNPDNTISEERTFKRFYKAIEAENKILTTYKRKREAEDIPIDISTFLKIREEEMDMRRKTSEEEYLEMEKQLDLANTRNMTNQATIIYLQKKLDDESQLRKNTQEELDFLNRKVFQFELKEKKWEEEKYKLKKSEIDFKNSLERFEKNAIETISKYKNESKEAEKNKETSSKTLTETQVQLQELREELNQTRKSLKCSEVELNIYRKATKDVEEFIKSKKLDRSSI